MNENAIFEVESTEVDYEQFDLESLEQHLEAQFIEQEEELERLKEDLQKIGTPEALGDALKNVIWEQFINQIGIVAGEDFIKENRGLTLDLRESAHIQTTENFAKGKIATHNHYSAEQLKKNYTRYTKVSHKEFREKHVNPGMDATLKRAGKLREEGVDTVRDIYTGRQISTKTKNDDGTNNPKAAQREHVKPSAGIYQDSSLQMSNTDEELAAVINSPENLQGYTTADRNNRKSDNSPNDMEERDKTKHWEQANERAERHLEHKRQEGEERLKAEGRKTRREETKRIGKTVLRSMVMSLLASLFKEIIQKLISWFRHKERKFSTFLDSLKEALKSFAGKLKGLLVDAAGVASTSVIVASLAKTIIGPVVSALKKAWVFLKQGYRSAKDAIAFWQDPQNQNLPLSIKMMQVGKIIVVGLSAGGAMALSGVIETALSSVPGFSLEIPFLGSLANLIGMFLGTLISGLIGALILNLIDRAVTKKLKALNEAQQSIVLDKRLNTAEHLALASYTVTQQKKGAIAQVVGQRHQQAALRINEQSIQIADRLSLLEEEVQRNKQTLQNIDNLLDNL